MSAAAWEDLDQLAASVLRHLARQGVAASGRLAWVRGLTAAAEAATTDEQLTAIRNHVAALLCSLEKGN